MTTATPTAPNQTVDAPIAAWVEQFHRDGFLFLPSVLPLDHIAELKADLDRAYPERGKAGGGIEICERMFEVSNANLRLFDFEPIVSFAEALIDGPCHVIHNNSFRSPSGGGITTWHQDDSAHYLVTHGEPPTNVRLPVLVFTCNYLLTDAPAIDYGPMQVVPGSHLFGRKCPPNLEGTEWEDRLVAVRDVPGEQDHAGAGTEDRRPRRGQVGDGLAETPAVDELALRRALAARQDEAGQAFEVLGQADFETLDTELAQDGQVLGEGTLDGEHPDARGSGHGRASYQPRTASRSTPPHDQSPP